MIAALLLAPIVLAPTLVAAQAVSAGLPSLDDDRLGMCLKAARTDPPSAIVTASQWAGEASGVEASLPQQCLGFAYVGLLRWDAAAEAFRTARDARSPGDRVVRARLGAMAGNAALAAGELPAAIELLSVAQADAEASGLADVAGEAAADRARALVGSDREAEAGEVLTGAQIVAPQVAEVWLLSATLARREGQLQRAQEMIAHAAALAPRDAEIGLEGGLIAALAGRDDAARASWQSVLAVAPDTPAAITARSYLARLDGGNPEAP